MATAIEFDHVGKQYRYSPDNDECLAIFIASCIESVADELGESAKAVFDRMDNVGLIDGYIIPCYDVLHSESRRSITSDILKTLSIWESKKEAAL